MIDPIVAQRIITLVHAQALVVTPADRIRITRDPDDDHLLNLAVEAGAEILVSGDKDLTTLGTFAGVSIATPRQLLDRLSSR